MNVAVTIRVTSPAHKYLCVIKFNTLKYYLSSLNSLEVVVRHFSSCKNDELLLVCSRA